MSAIGNELDRPLNPAVKLLLARPRHSGVDDGGRAAVMMQWCQARTCSLQLSSEEADRWGSGVLEP